MPQDFRALFAPDPGPDFKSLFAPDEISEEEANRTLTPEEQGKVVPQFGAGTARRMAEYSGLSPQDAAAKYRAGWADTIGNAYDTVTDPSKLGSAVAGVAKAGAHAVANPKETVNRIGNYYYENPDAAFTDAAFALFPGRQLAAKGFETVAKKAPSTAVPRAAVRDEGELLKTGGARIEAAKRDPSKVEADALIAPLQEFKDATKTIVIENPKTNNIVKRLQNAYKPRKPDPMSPMTGKQPKPRAPITLTELHGHQQRLDDVINGPGKSQDGRINSEGMAAIKLKEAIGKMIDEHPESGSFKIGKHEYHRGKMSQAMSDIEQRARQRAQWRNGDEAGALLNELNTYTRARKNRYAFSPDVRRKLGKLGGDRKGALIGGFGSTNLGGFTFARGAEVAMGLYPGTLGLLGYPARQARNKRVLDEFRAIQEEIRAGGPVGR